MRITRIRAAIFFVIALAIGVSMTPGGQGLYPNGASAASPVSSVKSGNWSDPTVWSTGAVPDNGDTVTIASGNSVTYNVSSNVQIAELFIDGTLRFSRSADTRLKMDGVNSRGNIIIRPGGFLDMGTQADFIPAGVNAEVIFVLPTDKRYIGPAANGLPHFIADDTGLWIMSGGKWESHGQPINRPWVKLTEDAQAGTDVLVVEHDVSDWAPGSEVIITSSTMPRAYYINSDGKETNSKDPTLWQEEVRTITSVQPLSNNRTRLTLNQPLVYFHSGTHPMRVEVGLLHRNVLVTTEVVGYSDAELVADFSKRNFAHTMYMPGSLGDLMYTEFKFMGAFMTLARYPIHLHQMDDTSRGKIIRGNSIWRSGHRWIAIHDSEGVLIEDNVGFDSVQSGYLTERTKGRFPLVDNKVVRGTVDNAFVHNLGVSTLKKKDGSIFWIEMLDNAFLGNVGTGAGVPGSDAAGQRASGFESDDRANNTGWTRPMVSIKNEFHTNHGNGIRSWNNAIGSMDIVDLHAWRNGFAGIVWGAYRAPFRYYQSELVENGQFGIWANSTEAFMQDGLISGGGNSGSQIETGLLAGTYTSAAGPQNPVRLTRTVFQNHRTGDFRQEQDGCLHPSRANVPITGDPCATLYVDSIGSHFLSAKPLEYGDTGNKNSSWKFFDYVGAGALPNDFVIMRRDQLDPGNRARITDQIVTNQSYYDAGIDGVITPMSSLPSPGIQFNDLANGDDPFTTDHFYETTPNYPPLVSLNVSLSGTTATMVANATDDVGVTKVEFYVDETLVGTETSAPYTVTVDLSTTGRKYAYLYAKAFDGTMFTTGSKKNKIYSPTIAYSEVTEIGPEVMVPGSPAPAPSVNQAPTVNAGPDWSASLTSPTTVALNGSVSDDGLPNPPASVSAQWSVVSGPGSVTFANANSASTTATFVDAGTYVLRLSASDGVLSSSDDVVVVIIPAPTNQAPLVSAGSDFSVTLPAAGTLNGSASDDGLPTGSSVSVQWSVVSFPTGASVTFADSNDAGTSATFSDSGTYILRLTASDSVLSSSDDVVVTVNAAAPPPPPGGSLTISNLSVVSGRPYQVASSLDSGDTIFIDRSYTYASLPTELLGADYIQTANADKRKTQESFISFNVDQDVTVYVGYDSRASSIPNWLSSWTATGNSLPVAGVNHNVYSKSFNAGQITLGGNAAPGASGARTSYTIAIVAQGGSTPPSNQAPVVDAGPDQSATLMSPVTITLNGSTSDDGLPSGSSVSVQWATISGPTGASVTFGSPNSTGTSATFTVAGTYVLRLTASDGDLSSSDDMSVTINPAPVNQAPVVNAGADTSVTLPAAATLSGSASDDGLPSGSSVSVQWSTVSGPASASVTFGSPNSAGTSATFTVAGTYVLRLTASDGDLSSSDDVSVTVNPAPVNQAPVVNAGTDTSVTLPAAATLSGSASDDGLPTGSTVSVQWSMVSGPSGASVTFGSPNSAGTSATFTDAGTYVLRLTASDGDLSSSDDVSVTVNPAPAPPTGGPLTISNLSVASGEAYQVMSGLSMGDNVFIDRGYTYTRLPSHLIGAHYIKTANDDKREKQTDFLSFSVDQNVTVFVAFDSRATSIPDWLASWNDTGDTTPIGGVNHRLFSKTFSAGSITLGGNKASGSSGANTMYSVIVVP